VGRPPQELMRGWGVPPIYKDSRIDRGLEIRAKNDLAERGEKGRCGGKKETYEE
jgi:hypothetical protein